MYPKRTSYYQFAKLNPTEDDENNLEQKIKSTESYCVYHVSTLTDDYVLLEGVMVFSKKISIFEAADLFPNFTLSFPDDFDSKVEEIMQNDQTRAINKHPALAIRCNLMVFFEDEI
jgi:hypothetical protein